MNSFLVKFTDESAKTVPGTDVCLSESIRKVALTENLEYENISYIDINLHNEEIRAGDEGYYLISAGNGTCKSRDYGIAGFKPYEDCEEVLTDCFMPVFGICHNKKSRIAIVTGFSGNAAQVIQIKDNTYTIKIRFFIEGHAPYENIAVEFHELGENATYSDMAREYRAYQLKNGFKPISERLNPKLKYSVESPNIRIRMAWKPVPCKIREQTPENEPPVHVACTFDDVIKIMESYKAAGIEKAEFCLVGWNMKGHDGRWPQAFPVESSIGGEEGLKRAIAKANELGFAMTCHTNSTDSYTVGETFKEQNVAIKRDGSKSIQAIRWSGGTTYDVCPKQTIEPSLDTLQKVADLGFSGMHYIDVITCTPPRECFHPEHPVNKKESCAYYDELFAKTKEIFGAAASEGAYDHSLKNCDYALYVSFKDYTGDDKKFALCEKTIPFFQLVYNGIVSSNPYARTVNPTASSNEDDLLKVIEYGGKPQFYYYAKFVDNGTDWIADDDLHSSTPEEIEHATACVKKASDIFKELSYLQYLFMEKHEEIAPNIFEVTYSDGSVVTVDYNKKCWSLNRH